MTEPDPDELRCLERGPDCSGPVEYRHAGGMNGKSWPRCTFHGQRRLDRHYDPTSCEAWADSDVPPSWFDPTAIGEQWEDD